MATKTYSGSVTDEQNRPIKHAEVRFVSKGKPVGLPARSDENGNYKLEVEYDDSDQKPTDELHCTVFGQQMTLPAAAEQNFQFNLGLKLVFTGASSTGFSNSSGTTGQAPTIVVGRKLYASIDSAEAVRDHFAVDWILPEGAGYRGRGKHEVEIVFHRPGPAQQVRAHVRDNPSIIISQVFDVIEPDVTVVSGEVGVHGNVRGDVDVRLHRTATQPTLDQSLWVLIRNRTRAISFPRYRAYIEHILHGAQLDPLRAGQLDTPRGVQAYLALKYFTERFLLQESGVAIPPDDFRDVDSSRLGGQYTPEEMEKRLEEYLGKPPRLPYIKNVIEDSFPWLGREGGVHDPVLLDHIDRPPLMELIHTYWLEEGMLMQTINAVSRRFQNVRAPGERDPLANMELDPLRRINNWLWGYIQDEVNRLSVKRRAFEYLHQYGLPLFGKAAPGLHAADTRSRFLEAFHNLLYQCSVFFKQDDQTTIIADAFPLLNALREVHLILAQGAANQFGDMPWAARVESLIVEFLLSQPAMFDFLQRRAMVPYQEAWMPQVDAMKTLQGWSDVTVTHFRDLAVYGEQILLSIRYGDWINVIDANHAANWARYFRAEIQGYLYAYRAATGVDLTSSTKVDATIPAFLLQHRLVAQQRAR
jgi:hypothetical protein